MGEEDIKTILTGMDDKGSERHQKKIDEFVESIGKENLIEIRHSKNSHKWQMYLTYIKHYVD